MRICVNIVIIAQIAIFGHCGATSRKGIEVVKLEPYETKKVKLTLSPRDFAVIEEDGSCVAVPGIYEISAGGQQPDDRSTKLTGKRTERIEIARCGEKTGVDY